MHVFYLHGFASSPASSKAAFLAGRLAPYGATLHVPDLNAPDFSTHTTTRMVAQVRADLAALRPASAVLVGSSLGAFVAWHVAAQEEASGHPPVALVLLAPALDFGHHRMAGLSDAEFDAWRATGWHTFQHYATGEPALIGAIAAVESQGRAGRVQIIGWDLSPQAIRGIRQGSVIAVIHQDADQIGYRAVVAALTLRQGGVVPEEAFVPVTTVTRDNVEQFHGLFTR